MPTVVRSGSPARREPWKIPVEYPWVCRVASRDSRVLAFFLSFSPFHPRLVSILLATDRYALAWKRGTWARGATRKRKTTRSSAPSPPPPAPFLHPELDFLRGSLSPGRPKKETELWKGEEGLLASRVISLPTDWPWDLELERIKLKVYEYFLSIETTRNVGWYFEQSPRVTSLAVLTNGQERN